MALLKLNKDFAGRAAAIGLGAATAFAPLTGAYAEDAKAVQTPATTMSATPASFTPVVTQDAGATAQDWSLENPGIAVAVWLGTESKITPTQIREVLASEFAHAGINDTTFFFEQNDKPSTAVGYFYAGASDGPFLLNAARPAARKAAEQYLFQQENPAFAFNFEQ